MEGCADRVTVAVMVCACLPSGAFIFLFGLQINYYFSLLWIQQIFPELSHVKGSHSQPCLGFTGSVSFYRSAQWSDLFQTRCSEQHSLFFLFCFVFLFFLFAYFHSCITIKTMHSYPCQPTCMVYVRTLINVHSAMYPPSCCAVKLKKNKKKQEKCTHHKIHCFLILQNC